MFREQLENWTDFDLAERALAISLGLMHADASPLTVKWVFWSDNPTGRLLMSILETLVTAGVLERNEDDQFRFSPQFEPL